MDIVEQLKMIHLFSNNYLPKAKETIKRNEIQQEEVKIALINYLNEAGGGVFRGGLPKEAQKMY